MPAAAVAAVPATLTDAEQRNKWAYYSALRGMVLQVRGCRVLATQKPGVYNTR